MRYDPTKLQGLGRPVPNLMIAPTPTHYIKTDLVAQELEKENISPVIPRFIPSIENSNFVKPLPLIAPILDETQLIKPLKENEVLQPTTQTDQQMENLKTYFNDLTRQDVPLKTKLVKYAMPLVILVLLGFGIKKVFFSTKKAKR